ncbi:hypothetical protein PVMG_02757 [Plasmodium vivax Mauritania I]|uniref:Uncharacterized protein n=1 Tax=Plasmodium vivax Mauritania I TaxID=1035515 RepID=A0A0J9W3M4_PLAVI|nr:hypothetical protein PVMG_02757 [Plasmodium vivax Mauritania I]
MDDELLDRLLFGTAEIRGMTSGKRNEKYFFTHSLEQSKIDMKKCFKNLITSKFFVFFLFTLLHLFVQNTSISDERNIYGELQLSYTYSRKLAEKEKTSRARKAPANRVKKKKVSTSSLKKEEPPQNTGETGGSGDATGARASVKAANSGAAKTGAGVKAGSSGAAKTSGEAAKTSSDTAKASGNAAKTSGDAAKTNGDATASSGSAAEKTSGDTATTVSDAAVPTSDAATSSSDATSSGNDATSSSSDATASSNDATTINGDATGTSSAGTTSGDSAASSGESTTSSGEATTSAGKEKVMRSCLKKATSPKREKRNVHFADPISREKIFYKDECIGYTGENEEKEKKVEKAEKEKKIKKVEEKKVGNEGSDIVSKKAKKKRALFFGFLKKKKKKKTLKAKVKISESIVKASGGRNNAVKPSTAQKEAIASSAGITNKRPEREKEIVGNVLRRSATLDNLSI